MDYFNPLYLLKLENREIEQDFLLYLYILLIIILLYNITNLVLDRIYPSKETSVIYNRRRVGRYFFSILAFLCLIPILYSRIKYLPTILAFTGAGLVISLKDITLNFIGWFLIHSHNGFSLGDRIEIDGVGGDVVNIGVMRFTLLEVNGDINSEQSTNRLIHIPNHYTLTKKIHLTPGKLEFIWDELSIHFTLKTNIELAEKICNEVMDTSLKKEAIQNEVENRFLGLSQNYWLKIGITTPIIYTSISERNIRLTLRYLVRVQEKRTIRSQLSKNLLLQLKKYPEIEIFGSSTSIFVDH